MTLTEAATMWLLAFLICRDGWNAADLGIFASGSIIALGGTLSLSSEFVSHERENRMRLLSLWFMGGGVFCYIIALLF